jgi:hypothetical protein
MVDGKLVSVVSVGKNGSVGAPEFICESSDVLDEKGSVPSDFHLA